MESVLGDDGKQPSLQFRLLELVRGLHSDFAAMRLQDSRLKNSGAMVYEFVPHPSRSHGANLSTLKWNVPELVRKVRMRWVGRATLNTTRLCVHGKAEMLMDVGIPTIHVVDTV